MSGIWVAPYYRMFMEFFPPDLKMRPTDARGVATLPVCLNYESNYAGLEFWLPQRNSDGSWDTYEVEREPSNRAIAPNTYQPSRELELPLAQLREQSAKERRTGSAVVAFPVTVRLKLPPPKPS
jgi:hypothetical protein